MTAGSPEPVAARHAEGILVRGTVTIDVDSCKGCELCVPACRPGVLRMVPAVNADGYHYPELLAGCTACRACFEVCPDFVFEVYRYDEPVLLLATEGEA